MVEGKECVWREDIKRRPRRGEIFETKKLTCKMMSSPPAIPSVSLGPRSKQKLIYFLFFISSFLDKNWSKLVI